MIDVQKTFAWLVQGAEGAGSPDRMLQRMCDELLAAGVPVHRAEAFVRTLHPNIAGRSFTWEAAPLAVVAGTPPPASTVRVEDRSFAYLNSPAFHDTPMAEGRL